jgi:tellurite resistance-related uncharacterized protein
MSTDSAVYAAPAVGLAMFALSVSACYAAARLFKSKPVPQAHVGPSYYSMPPAAEAYKKTKTFSADSIPVALQNNHNTAGGVWALIYVLRGELRYIVAPDEHCASEQTFSLDTTCLGLIQPKSYHRIQAMSDDVQCYVEFWKVMKR